MTLLKGNTQDQEKWPPQCKETHTIYIDRYQEFCSDHTLQSEESIPPLSFSYFLICWTSQSNLVCGRPRPQLWFVSWVRFGFGVGWLQGYCWISGVPFWGFLQLQEWGEGVGEIWSGSCPGEELIALTKYSGKWGAEGINRRHFIGVGENGN